jgi:PadR family transcriptional regulator
MAKGTYLGEFEQLVILAVLRLGHEAYGMKVRRELEQTARRHVTIGSVYGTLERLQDEFYKVAFRRTIHETLEKLQGDSTRT